MSAIEIGVALLKAASAVTDITTTARLYPVDFPQNAAPPCCIVNLVGGTDEHMLQGAGGYYRSRIEVTSLAATALEASQLDKAVKATLESVIHADVGTYTDVDVAFADTEMSDTSDDRSTYRFLRHFNVRWRDA